jgi:hypothetical protein
LIHEAYARSDDETIRNEVLGGRFDLVNPIGATILPNVYESLVTPGRIAILSLWSKPVSSDKLRRIRNEARKTTLETGNSSARGN